MRQSLVAITDIGVVLYCFVPIPLGLFPIPVPPKSDPKENGVSLGKPAVKLESPETRRLGLGKILLRRAIARQRERNQCPGKPRMARQAPARGDSSVLYGGGR